MSLITSPRGRAKRVEYKLNRVTEFMSRARFADREAIRALLDFKRADNAHELMTKLERAGYYKRESVPIIGRCVTIWRQIGYRLPRQVNLNHALAVRLNHALALRAGFTDWTYSAHGPASQGAAYPDATARPPGSTRGTLVAIEIECTPKADYTETVINRLSAREKEHWIACLYLCPTRQIAETVRRRLAAIGTFDLNGRPCSLSLSGEWLKIHTFDEWQTLGGLLGGAFGGLLGGSLPSSNRKNRLAI